MKCEKPHLLPHLSMHSGRFPSTREIWNISTYKSLGGVCGCDEFILDFYPPNSRRWHDQSSHHGSLGLNTLPRKVRILRGGFTFDVLECWLGEGQTSNPQRNRTFCVCSLKLHQVKLAFLAMINCGQSFLMFRLANSSALYAFTPFQI